MVIGLVEIAEIDTMGTAEINTLSVAETSTKIRHKRVVQVRQEKWLWASLCLLEPLVPQKSLQSGE